MKLRVDQMSEFHNDFQKISLLYQPNVFFFPPVEIILCSYLHIGSFFFSSVRCYQKCRYFMPNKLQAQSGSLLDYTIQNKRRQFNESFIFRPTYSNPKNAKDNCVEIFKCTNNVCTKKFIHV